MQQDASFGSILLPLTNLSISDVRMTDNGFKYLVQRFEAIYIQHGQSGRQVDLCMQFNFSKNILSESAITCFADLLRKFNAFIGINMSS